LSFYLLYFCTYQQNVKCNYLDFIILNLPLVISCDIDIDSWDPDLKNLLDYSLLANYDGQGSCKKMIFQIHTRDFETINEHLGPWAKAVNWKFTQVDERKIIIKRLCLLEKYFILFEQDGASLNQRDEFFGHCFHKKPQLKSAE